MMPEEKQDPSREGEDSYPFSANNPLVEGEDYYLEAGFFVFMAKYHLKRGYCCKNGCRHCPYQKKKGPEEII